MERLDKILSSQGVGSRKEAGILIRRGLVHVNGILATRPETKTGLLILTDDGELAHRMLSPKKHVYKLYEASVDGPVGAEEIEKFAAGVALEDGTVCLPAGLTVVKQGTAWETLVEIREGKCHQVQKMFLAVGRRVLRLKRVRIGGLELDKTLKEGECRELTKEEMALIFQGENRRFCEKKNSNGQI